MTTTAAGDAAVARLNKATEAFEKIITGASNQVVDVPGYGNQPTLAARVDERLDETTATAAAEADRSRDEADRATTQANAAANSVTLATAEFNKAKTQADRAQSEADRAAQITGLDTVSDAVAMAALPLPDVWAPLSDSLRMITGYGREVKVGEDVVARMVNFSRNSTATYIGKDGLLKTAAVNEPRFEKEGLLIEGQSTNLAPQGSLRISEVGGVVGWSLSGAAGITNSVSEVVDPRYGTLVRFGAGVARTAYVLQSLGGFEVGATYTISAHCPHDDTGLPIMRVLDKALTYTRVGDRVFATFVAEATSLSFQIGKGVMAGTTPLESSVVMGNIQITKHSFVSSYIPTNGAAVTRAADAIQIPYAGNGVPLSDMQMTMSAVIKTNLRPGEPTALIDALDITPNVGVFLSTPGQIDTRIFDVQWSPGIKPDMTKEQVVALSFNGATGAVAMRVGDKVVTGTVVVPKGISRSAGNIGLLCRSGINTRTGFGSIRDLKIWHKFFTVGQLKAIK